MITRTIFLLIFSIGASQAVAQTVDELRAELRAHLGKNWRPGYELWTSELSSFQSIQDAADTAQCGALYEEIYSSLVEQYADRVREISLRHTADAIRLGCEVARLQAVIPPLQQSAISLREGADALDAQFVLANSIAPEKFPAVPGHDASQQRMRRDADANEAAIRSIEADIAKLSTLSRRAQELALQEDQTIVSAMDPKAQLELLRALLSGGGTAQT
ncbi:hypothetical protein [Phaeobacter inhibens]|uniref:hypothetical protein n=1 Tax=Phaeobacter inhibens TaxID=221822 RepID=UPI0021A7D02E|nr:hypothetical protein [Phaeobacter inhibens]UWR87815.1 hypothetical protein K4L01_13750 [Phaeobacter inhibens]